MRKVSILLSLVFIVGIVFTAALAFADVIAEADALYETKDMASVKKAITMYKGVLDGNEEAAWKFSRASYWVGVRTDDPAVQEGIFDEAYNAVRPYYDAGTDNIHTNYWFALNAGKYGKLHGILRSLFLVKPMKTACNKVISQDPSYEDGAALTILGAIEFEVPGGDLDMTISYCKRALKYDPDGISPNLYLAKAYNKQKKYDLAKERLEHLIAKAKPDTKDEQKDVAEAKELLEEVNAELAK
jgi:tetratricopeptide (TPR) repeat protein